MPNFTLDRFPPLHYWAPIFMFTLVSCTVQPLPSQTLVTTCEVELLVLGAGQDAGAPQIGNPSDPAWQKSSRRLTATALALVFHSSGQRFLFEATPHITQQLQLLDELAPTKTRGLGIDGIFLTHAHIGHYAGLMFLGREAAGATSVPVFAMPRMAAYLKNNGPWSQLVELENIRLQPLQANQVNAVNDDLIVTPLLVPHRDEFSETVGYLITAGGQQTLFVPDIDSWQQWQDRHGIDFADLVDSVDLAFVDATFFDDNELPGRDMSKTPHPRVRESMALLSDRPAAVRARLHFIHYNHTNPIRDPTSKASQEVRGNGFRIARRGDRICLAPRT
ncbi:MAG: MBL fold metallo-hydrolase [Pseudomonadota bacterium]